MLSLWFGAYDQGLAYAGLALGTLLTLRILKGESPATMPFEPLTTTTLLLNGATAKAIGVSLPQTAGAAQLMQACAANGMDQLDHSALVQALELMANHAVAKG
jgi:ABC-type uncharacterized transport system substrate-binding protein